MAQTTTTNAHSVICVGKLMRGSPSAKVDNDPGPWGKEAAVDQAEGENGKEGLEKDSHQNQTGLCQRDPSPTMLKLQKLKPKLEVGVCNPLCGYRSMRPTQA